MVENADDDPEETKPIFVENSRDVKPAKVEAKLNLDGASINKIPITIPISVFWSFTGIFQPSTMCEQQLKKKKKNLLPI